MGVFNNLGSLLFGDDVIDTLDDIAPEGETDLSHLREEEKRTIKQPLSHAQGSLPLSVDAVTMNTRGTFKIVVRQPTKYDDGKALADCLACYEPVIVDFSRTQSDVANRIYSFLCGATYAMGGNIKKLNANTYIFATSNVRFDISGFDCCRDV